MMSPEINEIAAALAKAQGEMRAAEKDAANPFFKSKYADLASVWDAAREPLSKHGLSITQIPTTSPDGKFILETVLMHSSGQWISGSYPINPTKNDPQGLGSALTYARRYSMCPMVGVIAKEEDDDAEHATRRERIGTKPPLSIAPAQEVRVSNTEYVVPFACKFHGKRFDEISLEELSDACNAILKRHEETKKPIAGVIEDFLERARQVIAERMKVHHA